MEVNNLLNIPVCDVSIFPSNQIQTIVKLGYGIFSKRYQITRGGQSKADIIFRIIFANSLISLLTKCIQHNASTNHNPLKRS